MLKKLLILCFAFSLTACADLEGSISPLAAGTAMPKGEPTAAPLAFAEYCSRNPADCKLPATADMLGAVSEANAQSKDLVIPEAEQGTDIWEARTAVGPGDCEDFALTMRRILRGRFPEYSGSFLMATAYTEDNQYHAVLTIETTNGTIVCDIRYPECAPWDAFPYEWRLREVAGASHWLALGPHKTLPQVATASAGN